MPRPSSTKRGHSLFSTIRTFFVFETSASRALSRISSWIMPPGGTLRDRHPSGSVIAFPTLLTYVKQVTEALAYIHRRKLIHRDVKPENMLIDAYGHILLADFGIATVAHRTASLKTIDHSGTVYYMAPEQIKGKPCEA